MKHFIFTRCVAHYFMNESFPRGQNNAVVNLLFTKDGLRIGWKTAIYNPPRHLFITHIRTLEKSCIFHSPLKFLFFLRLFSSLCNITFKNRKKAFLFDGSFFVSSIMRCNLVMSTKMWMRFFQITRTAWISCTYFCYCDLWGIVIYEKMILIGCLTSHREIQIH